MQCEECGGDCELYDGGEANDYSLEVYVCTECGHWNHEGTDEGLDD